MPANMPEPAVIFFDIDNTLLDNDTAQNAGLHTLTERLGHPAPTAASRLWHIQTDLSHTAYINGRLSLTEKRREPIRALATQAGHAHLSDDHCDTLFQHYLDTYRSAWRSFPDVAPTLNHLTSTGITLGIITNGTETIQRDKLDTLDLTRYFRSIVCADTAGAAKPDPAIFHAACHHLGVPPEKCWHVGDQLRTDTLGALAAGLHPILLNRTHHPTDTDDITTITSLDQLTHTTAEAR
ncbi:HAD family hydrolase [Salinactinospora qingdaonensis]|uniref:HAD family hydrolase n=1 Tax=Salinactinospora qingdaonensis TaxID=702744 RepID=A0ABP7GMX5_9ACTN